MFAEANEQSESVFFSPIESAVAYIRARCAIEPEIAIILPQLQKLPEGIEIEVQIAYDSIPFFPYRTMEYRPGVLLFGKYKGVPMVALQGIQLYRYGFFEQTPLAIALASALGAKRWGYVGPDGEVEFP
jgi:purine-nucleoside phosphorylase